MPLTDALPTERSHHHRERMEKLMQMDFELLNTVLGLEINSQMNPEVIRNVLRRRCAELSKEERRALPQIVVEVVVALCGDSMAKEFEKYLKKKPVMKLAPPPALTLTHEVDMVNLVMDGTPPEQLREQLSGTKGWNGWCWQNSVAVTVTPEGIRLKSSMFTEFTVDDIKAVLRRFGL